MQLLRVARRPQSTDVHDGLTVRPGPDPWSPFTATAEAPAAATGQTRTATGQTRTVTGQPVAATGLLGAATGQLGAATGQRPGTVSTRRDVAPALADATGLTTSRASAVPRVFAHRGASSVAPEHSLAAYRTALEQGADGIECDVRLTADRHLVCVHDRRTDRTTGERGVVSALELADLAALNFAARHDDWHDFEGPAEPDHDRSGVLTLETLLGMVADTGRRVEVAIETKHPTRYAGLVERTVVDTLKRFGLAAPRGGSEPFTYVMSFSWVGLRRVRALAPRIPTVFLMERVPIRFRDGSLPVGVSIAGPSIEVIRKHPTYVERAHQRGHRVFSWVVNEPADVDRCAQVGIDAVITDRPLAARSRLHR